MAVATGLASSLAQIEAPPISGFVRSVCAAYDLTMAQLLLDVDKAAPSKVAWGDAFSWQDQETLFRRTSISPPQLGYQVELIWAELPAVQRIEYGRPPQEGVEQHVVVVSGALTVECQNQVLALSERDCLRFHLSGPTAFENKCKRPTAYIIAHRRLS